MAVIEFGPIRVTYPLPHVAEIVMRDEVHRNTFSPELMEGMKSAFAHIETDLELKVVILTGYDNYFAAGSTQKDLVRLQRGEVNFLHLDYFDLPMRCEIPVIAAMQGHAIGGGLILGLYADFTILAKESIYAANFMKYGFTPGVGATFLLPLKFGQSLGTELLFSGRNYRGDELSRRGVPLQVVDRTDVVREARQLASILTEKPRISLVTLKRHLTQPLKPQIAEIMQKELKMHEVTFNEPEVIKNIDMLFDE